jgi:hypothetical protein
MRLLLVMTALVLLPSVGLAQQDMGVITGLVVDASGAVLPGVAVTAREQETGVAVTTTTNATGLFVIASLKIGTYTVEAGLAGFKKAVARDVGLHAGDRARVDFKLELGALAQEVRVVSDTPLLRTESSSLSHIVKDIEMRELPIAGRNFQNLATLAAGVLPAIGHRDREGGFNAHGQWATQNNFILDGIDNNSQILGLQDRKAQVLLPSLDAVQEFQIQTSNYSAEYGRNAGAVMNVTIKSGTNQVHGTAYEFLRNDVFDARDAFVYTDRDGDGKADPDALRRNQYGATLGGPLRRNQTFYFGSFEGTQIHTTSSSLATIPTLLERQGIFNSALVTVRDPATGQPFPNNAIPQSRWDPVAARMAGLWPEPNFQGTTRANYVSSPRVVRDRYQYDFRVDHNFSAVDRAFVRVSRMMIDIFTDGPLPAPAVGAPNNDTARDENTGWNLASSYTHVFGNAIVNEARFGYSNLVTDKLPLISGFPNDDLGLRVITPEPVGGLGRLTFGGAFGYQALGEATFVPNYKLSRTVQFLDNLSVVKGRHNLKAGADLRWITSDTNGAPNTRGVFGFNGRFTNSSVGDFLLGWTNQVQFSTFQRADLRERDYMFYLQDDWKLSPRLTLNAGVRYELSSPMFDVNDRVTTLDVTAFPSIEVLRAGERGRSWSDRALVDADTNNWAPRLGFAWQPRALWTLRGAAGVFYGTTGGGLGLSSRLSNNWPIYRDVTLASTTTRPARQLSLGLDPSLLGDETEMPANLNWNVWERDFQLPTIYQWNLSVQRQLGPRMVATASYVGSASHELPRAYNINGADPGDPATERQRRLIPALGGIDFRETSGRASYHGLETTLEKRFSDGWQFSASYTWSHSIDDVGELFGAEGGVIQDKRNLGADKGSSGFDRRHRFAASYIAQLPFGRGRRWMGDGGALDAIFGGWQLSGIVQVQTGAPFTVTIASPTQFLGVTASSWRPDVVGDWRVDDPGPEQWMRREAFVVPQNPDGTYRFGNLGRNALTGPGYFNIDAGLMKDFFIGRERRLQFRWEVFNATNHPSYGLPVTNLQSVDFGTIRSTVSVPRQMQLGVKFIF